MTQLTEGCLEISNFYEIVLLFGRQRSYQSVKRTVSVYHHPVRSVNKYFNRRGNQSLAIHLFLLREYRSGCILRGQ
jgi:hypothetical protein